MSKHRQLLYGHPVPQSWFDAIQEFISTAAVNFEVALVPQTMNQVQISAGPNNDQVGIGIDGLWRYNVAPVSAAVTGPAGTYDIYVTCNDNNFITNPTPPPPEVDNTVYSFQLASVAAGSTPTGVAHSRKIAEAAFDGTRILMVRQLVGGATDGSQLWQPGMIQMSGAANPPAGWLLCNGAAVSRSTYAALYAALGGPSSPWGQGDGSTTFNVPDLRSRVPIGAGQGSGLANRALAVAGGAEQVALAMGNLPAHPHNAGTLQNAGHGHTFTGTAHGHTFTGAAHGHTFTGAAHGHTFTGAGHSHLASADSSRSFVPISSASWSGQTFAAGSGGGRAASSGAGSITGTQYTSNVVAGGSVSNATQGGSIGNATQGGTVGNATAGGTVGATAAGTPAISGATANVGTGWNGTPSPIGLMQPFLPVNYFIKT